EAPTTEAPTTEAPTTEAPTTEAPTTEPPVVRPDIELYYGDADLDGKVKASDARKILRHAARIEFIEEALALAAADLDRNGKVNAKDARAALRVAGRIDEKQPFDEQATPFEPEKPTEEPTEPAAPPTKNDRRIHIPAGGTYILTMSANEIRDPAIDDDGQGSFVVIDAPGEITGTHYIMISPIDPVGEKELAIYEYGNENDKPYTTITIDTDSGEPVFARSDGIPDIGAIYAVTPTYFSAAEQTDGPTVFSFLYAIEYDYFMHSSIDDILTRCDEELEANGYYFLGVETDEYGVAYSCYQNANGSFMDYALVRDEEFGTMLLIEYFEYGE
ncbi:MAG: hypothetical protein IJL26_09075, partial [Clostridia bacterium]|nr:hypothetical protein [Clostridia bacterium]